jgi:hypothetical protein
MICSLEDLHFSKGKVYNHIVQQNDLDRLRICNNELQVICSLEDLASTRQTLMIILSISTSLIGREFQSISVYLNLPVDLDCAEPAKKFAYLVGYLVDQISGALCPSRGLILGNNMLLWVPSVPRAGPFPIICNRTRFVEASPSGDDRICLSSRVGGSTD